MIHEGDHGTAGRHVPPVEEGLWFFLVIAVIFFLCFVAVFLFAPP